MPESDEILIACLAYCLTWEVRGAHASQHWSKIHQYVKDQGDLTETERWICELYEEMSPSAQEERSILSRINARLDHPRRVVFFRKSILALLPDSLQEAAAKHHLMHALVLPQGYGRIRSWLAEHTFSRLRSASEPVPLATREADFLCFIEQPYFIEGFRKFWKQEPKYRNNKQTRVLLSVAAALSQMVAYQDTAELIEWSHRLGRMGNYTEQTCCDVSELSLTMLNESYDPQEIGYRLLVDAKESDRRVLVSFCERYADDLTAFARDLVRSMQMAI